MHGLFADTTDLFKIYMSAFLVMSCDPWGKDSLGVCKEAVESQTAAPGTLEANVGKQLLCTAWFPANFLSFTRSYNQSKVASNPTWLILNPDIYTNY